MIQVSMSDTGLQSAAEFSVSFVDHETIVAESGALVSRLILSGASNVVNAENSDRYAVLDYATATHIRIDSCLSGVWHVALGNHVLRQE